MIEVKLEGAREAEAAAKRRATYVTHAPPVQLDFSLRIFSHDEVKRTHHLQIL